MSKFYLVIVDTTGIQSYIFGSNRLRENVGASYLVHMATSGWLMSQPDTLLPKGGHNIDRGDRLDDKHVETDETLLAELLYAGGGNSVLIFRDEDDVKAFGHRLSKRLLEEAPGLEAVMVVEEFTWSQDGSGSENLAAVMDKAMKQMSKKKSERERHQPLLGLGVTAACASTGLVANYHETEPGTAQDEERSRLSISAEVAAKWDNNKAAKTRLEQELPIGVAGYVYPDEFDDLGRTEGEQSYIGVVHADGNSIGNVLESITKSYAQKSPPQNRNYISELRRFSDEANRVGLEALREVVEAVAQWNQDGEKSGDQPPQPGQMALRPRKNTGAGETFISIRPIVFGGDDVTFVCDGRIALQAAKVFLDAFGERTIYDKPASACAGVAIVKVRYPFARAYQLAEALTKNAKTTYERKVPAVDWHLAHSGLFGELGQIRAEEYKSGQRSLLMRPLVAAKGSGEWRTWDNFVAILREFQRTPQNSEGGKWPRNKVMDLRVELVNSRWDNGVALERFIAQLGASPQKLKLPKIENAQADHVQTGWDSDRCVYFDAIESIDQMVAYEIPEDTQTEEASS